MESFRSPMALSALSLRNAQRRFLDQSAYLGTTARVTFVSEARFPVLTPTLSGESRRGYDPELAAERAVRDLPRLDLSLGPLSREKPAEDGDLTQSTFSASLVIGTRCAIRKPFASTRCRRTLPLNACPRAELELQTPPSKWSPTIRRTAPVEACPLLLASGADRRPLGRSG
jgi:hypothetical protein